jgi:glycosyltransferase involved in cell wall biosynthesis
MDRFMSSPQISVVLPVYNGGVFLSKAIESILNQTYADFEFIIINDGSKDGSKELIDLYAAQDNRIIAVHQENAGLVASLNRGVALAKAPLIARMDADDIAFPERFAKQFAYLQQHPDVVVLGTSIRLIDENEKPIYDMRYPVRAKEVAKSMFRTNPMAHPTVMMRTDIVREAGGYNPLYQYNEDYDLWLRLSEKYKLANLPDIYLLYRQHPHKVSFQNSRDQTLRGFVSQLASKTRRQGKEDPIRGLKDITQETLDLFPLTKYERSQLLFRTFEYTLNAHIFNKDEQPILEVISEARKMVRGKEHDRFLSLILLKASLFYVINKQFSKAYRLVKEGFILSPVAFFQTAFRLGIRVIRRTLRKMFKK